MNRNGHIIQKQILDVEKVTSGNAFVFKDQLADFCQAKLLPAIEKLFDAKVPKDRILRTDKIIIDLGHLPEENWEDLFIARVMEELTKCISDATSVKVSTTSLSFDFQFTDNQGMAMSPEHSNTMQEITKQENISRSIFYFLKSGLLPWYSAIKNQSDLNDGFIELIQDTQFFNRLIDLLVDNDPAIDRMTLQLNESVLQSVIQRAGFDVEMVRSLILFLREIFVRLKITSTTNKLFIYRALIKATITCERNVKGKSDWSEYTDTVLTLIFKKFVTSGLERIIPMLSESAFVAYREKSFKTINSIQEIKKVNRDVKHDNKGVEESTNSTDELFDVKLPTDLHRSKKTVVTDENEVIYIANSGLVLLHPFLYLLFENVGYIYNKVWVSISHQQRAIFLTQFLVTGKDEFPEFDLFLNKILLEYPVDESLPSEIVLSEFEKQEANDVLKSVIKHWTALKNTTIEGLQSSFLMREGKLTKRDTGWFLQVEGKTIDILMGRIPWSFSIVKTPWMTKRLNVEWVK